MLEHVVAASPVRTCGGSATTQTGGHGSRPQPLGRAALVRPHLFSSPPLVSTDARDKKACGGAELLLAGGRRRSRARHGWRKKEEQSPFVCGWRKKKKGKDRLGKDKGERLLCWTHQIGRASCRERV